MISLKKLITRLCDAVNGIEERELIWENPNPSSAFTAQDIDSSSAGWISGKVLADYDEFEFEWRDGASNDLRIINFTKGLPNSIIALTKATHWHTYNNPTYDVEITRSIVITNSKFEFARGFYKYFNSNSSVVSNDYAIPLQIYGIKRGQKTYTQPAGCVDYVTHINSDGSREWNSGAVDNYNTYSTSEQRIGTWIDGKPIYRITVVADNPGTGISVPNLPNNINIVNLSGIWIENDNFTHTFRGRTDSAAHSCVLDCIQLEAKMIYLYRGSSVVMTKAIFYIEYIKLND